MSPVVGVVLESSHSEGGDGHRDFYREYVDRPVLESYCCEFEELLTMDGCTGIAVIGCDAPVELQFDEHKLLMVYARDLRPFEEIFQQQGIVLDDHLALITEGEHLHTTELRYAEAFRQLQNRLGAGQAAEHINW
jgi:hypothetical protein